MSKESLKPEERKTKFSITIDPILFNKINELESNKSRYIERLIFLDLIKNKKINENTIF